MSIVLDHVTKRFDGVAVVDDLSLEIADGELFVLLGASGSGKSTVLRLIAGLALLDSGRILLHGRRVDDLPPQKRGVGFVFQSYALFRHMTVEQNIEFGLKIRGVSPRDRGKRCQDLLEVVGLTGLGDRYPAQLSGGQMQRVAIARALAYEPAVLLLDEPFGALDVKIRGHLRSRLRAIQRALKVTTILVTHDQEEAFELGDRIGVMEGGRLVEVGRPADLYRRPRSEFVASFVGLANVIVGRIEGGKVALGAVTLEAPPEAAGVIAESSSVRVLCRPEEIDIAREPHRLGGHLLGRATVVERLFAGSGERFFVRLDLRGARPIFPVPDFGEEGALLQVLVRPEGPSESLPAVGEQVYVSLRTFHVFAHRGIRVLVCADPSPGSEVAIAFGLMLARALEGPVTLLGVAPTEDETAALHGWIESTGRALSRPGAPGPAFLVKTRVGLPATEIEAELEEHPYELVLLGGTPGASSGRTVSEVTAALRAPVLVVPAPRSAIRRILVCTAAGEPGKADIEFGGRIARRTSARVTILHVRPADAPPDVPERAEAHLEKGLRTLARLGVKGEVKVRRGPVVDEVFGEAREGDHDLIVIGAHGPSREPGRLVRAAASDLAREIITRSELPVLVVPLHAI